MVTNRLPIANEFAAPSGMSLDIEAQELPLTIPRNDAELCGILHIPRDASPRGVVVIVGGSQYRVGSHRQFVLLARALARSGIPVLRFDYQGMGDSSGEYLGFEHINGDLQAVIDRFFQELPQLREVVLWGLCDAASAACFYGPNDGRVCGLVLLNPWVRTETGAAKAYLRYYYARRLMSLDLWAKIRHGDLEFGQAWRSFIRMIATVLCRPTCSPGTGTSSDLSMVDPLPQRMAVALSQYRGKVLLILSGMDLTAREFKDTVSASRRWRRILQRLGATWRDFPEADHTFSRRKWREQVETWTLDWLRSW